MQENTNKALFINSLFLYAKLIVVTITGLVTTRYALIALGVDDYGLFSVLGGVISFIGIFNTIMLNASHRFIAVAVGKGDANDINTQFNISLVIHILIAILTIILFMPLGDLYIRHYVNYSGYIEDAVSVFHYSMMGSVISFVGVPYNALLMAKERFSVFSITDILTHLLKMGVAISLVYCIKNKLLVYALSQAVLTGISTIVFFLFCKIRFADLIRFKLVKNKKRYKEIFNYSSWVAFGAVATVGKNQGASMLINAFFNTAMNTALGLANTVSALMNQFANSVASPMTPQLTKSYAAGNMKRSNELLIMSTKYTFLVTLCIAAPFIVNPYVIFRLWLGQVPEYVVLFSYLVIIEVLITSMNSGISNIIFASGKIKLYQIVINILRILSIVSAFIVLKYGAPAQSLLITYIVFAIIIFIAGQWVLHKTLNYDNFILWKHSYIPSIATFVIFIGIAFFSRMLPAFLDIVVAEVLLLFTIFVVALSSKERKGILDLLKKKNFTENN